MIRVPTAALVRQCHGMRPVPWLLALVLTLMLTLPRTADAQGALERVRQQGILRACMWQPPSTLGEPLQTTAIERELLALLASELGLRLEISALGLDRLGPALVSGQCDVAMALLPRTQAQLEVMRFARPLLQVGLRAVVATGNRGLREWADLDRPGRRLVVGQGTHAEAVMRPRLGHAELVAVPPERVRMEDLDSGRIDAFVLTEAIAQRVSRLYPGTRLITPSASLPPLPISMAVAAGDEPWLRWIDDFGARIQRDGRLRAVAERHGATALLAP